MPQASAVQLGSQQPLPGTVDTHQHTASTTKPGGSDQQQSRAEQGQDRADQGQDSTVTLERQSALEAKAVDSAVAAADEVVQQLSAEEQEDVRSAVAAAAQQVAQQQRQQAAMMNAGQAYPQVCTCCAVCIKHQKTTAQEDCHNTRRQNCLMLLRNVRCNVQSIADLGPLHVHIVQAAP